MTNILGALIILIILLLASILAIQIYFIVYQDAAAANTFYEMNTSIKLFGWSLWELIQPVLQLALLLAVLLFFYRNSGMAQRFAETRSFGSAFNTQSAIALIIIGSFAVAALTRPEAATQLKEIALVVVGFYFGTRQRRGEAGDAEANPADQGPAAGPGQANTPASSASGPSGATSPPAGPPA
jgi:hypothetical protein